MLTYCFESACIPRTLAKCRKSDLAVVDTEGKETEESKTPVSASEDVPAGRDEQIADELPEQKNED